MSSNRNHNGIADFGDLLDQEYDYAQPKRGDIRDAAILQINDSEIVVDLGVKRDGIVPPQDIERLDPQSQ
jgi:ribosomal protein S1